MKVAMATKRRQLNQAVSVMPRRTRKNWLVIGGLALLALLLIAGFQFVRSKPHNAAEAPKVAAPVATVTTHTVGFNQIANQISASGTISSRHSIDIGAEVSGLRIVEVLVDEGDYVQAGQVMARMNSDILQTQLSREQARLRANQASVSKARQPNRAEDIAGLMFAASQAEAAVSQAQANLLRAETNLANLKSTAARYELLQKQGAISDQEAQDRQAAATMAQSEVAASKQQLEAARFAAGQARERHSAARAGGRHEDVSISLADLSQTQASIRQIKAQIDQTIVRAPKAGVVTRRLAEPGEIAMAGQALFSMTADGQLELHAQVQEIDIPAVRPGNTVVVTPASPELKPFTATVREVAELVDSKTRLGMAYVQIPAGTQLKDGMFANALIRTGDRNSLTVPTKSVLVQEGNKVVFVLSGQTVARRVIQTGGVAGSLTEIISGVVPGETIVVDGAGFLKDGDAVRVFTALAGN